MSYLLIGPSFYMDEQGRCFEKKAGVYEPVRTKETEAEDRYVERHLRKGDEESEKN